MVIFKGIVPHYGKCPYLHSGKAIDEKGVNTISPQTVTSQSPHPGLTQQLLRANKQLVVSFKKENCDFASGNKKEKI